MKRIGFLSLILSFAVLSIHAQDASVPAEGIAWKPFEEAVETAQKSEKKLLIDVYAPWCPWCRKLQREVYTDPKIKDYLAEHFIVTRLDAEDGETKHTFKDYTLSSMELAQGLGAKGFPTTVFLEANSDYITRLPGFVEAQEFLQVLRFIGTNAFRDLSYQEYAAQQKK